MSRPILDPLETALPAQRRALGERVADFTERPQLIAPNVYVGLPYSPGSGPDTLWYCGITTATLGGFPGGSPWFAAIPRVARAAFYVEIPWYTDAATTGEVRISCAGGLANSATRSLAANSSGTEVFRWLHGRTLWTGQINLDVHARRASGAGVVHIGYPTVCLIDPQGCTAAG